MSNTPSPYHEEATTYLEEFHQEVHPLLHAKYYGTIATIRHTLLKLLKKTNDKERNEAFGTEEAIRFVEGFFGGYTINHIHIDTFIEAVYQYMQRTNYGDTYLDFLHASIYFKAEGNGLYPQIIKVALDECTKRYNEDIRTIGPDSKVSI